MRSRQSLLTVFQQLCNKEITRWRSTAETKEVSIDMRKSVRLCCYPRLFIRSRTISFLSGNQATPSHLKCQQIFLRACKQGSGLETTVPNLNTSSSSKSSLLTSICWTMKMERARSEPENEFWSLLWDRWWWIHSKMCLIHCTKKLELWERMQHVTSQSIKTSSWQVKLHTSPSKLTTEMLTMHAVWL